MAKKTAKTTSEELKKAEKGVKKQDTAKSPAKAKKSTSKDSKAPKKAEKVAASGVLRVWHRADGRGFVTPEGKGHGAPHTKHVADITKYEQITEAEFNRPKNMGRIGKMGKMGLVATIDGMYLRILEITYLP